MTDLRCKFYEIRSFFRNIVWLRAIVNRVEIYLKGISKNLSLWSAQIKLSRSWSEREKVKTHNLPAQLIVSLTSYPDRFNSLHLALKCLLTQTMAPDRLILWIAYQDKELLTDEILNLRSAGLEILYCDDLRSYKKIIPTLNLLPDAFVVTADDDLYYWPTWLEELVNGYSGNNFEVICHRAHEIKLNDLDMPLPYNQWELEVKRNDASELIFPTSGAGAMYPPKIFHSDVLSADLFMNLCPNGDDIWLYWMVRLKGGRARKIGKRRKLIAWSGTQETSLGFENFSNGGNDKQINAIINHYGFN